MRYRAPILSMLGTLVLLSANAYAGNITKRLKAELDRLGPNDEVAIIIEFKDKVKAKDFNDADKALRRENLIVALKDKLEAQKTEVLALLTNDDATNVRELWLINGLAARVKASLVKEIANEPKVDTVDLDDQVVLVAGIPSSCGLSPAGWNLSAVRAAELWGLGYYGAGTVVATMDSGADPDHPDIAANWRGGTNSWYDPNGEHSSPYDANGHGTWALGLLVGGSAGGAPIGMAPGAQWISVKIFDDSGSADLSDIHAGFQWVLDPDGDPGTNDAPDIVNNSWVLDGTVDQCDTEFQADIDVLKAAEIAVVFAAGNTGPGYNTSVSPSNDPQSMAAGSVAEAFSILYVDNNSARGGSACTGGIYPQVAAPGANVVTADRTLGGVFPDSYTCVSGTSFAAPHVSGAMALLKGAMDSQGISVTVSQLETALQEGAVDMGDPGPDNDWGAGLLDVAEAHNWLLANAGSPQPGVLQFSAGAYSVAEDVGNMTVTVTRTGGTAGQVTVDYATSDGSATAGADYADTSGTLTFLDGETSQAFNVPILDDGIVESDETVNVTLSNPGGGASLGNPTTAVLTIQDNDVAGTLQFSTAIYSVGEAGGIITITVTRTDGSAGDVTVDYGTADGSATAGEDYQATSGTLSLLDGETSQTFTVNILDDTVYEGDEDASLSLSNPTGGATLGGLSTATLVILEDDTQGGGSDNDGDGYDSDVDCNDDDATIYPGAPEIKHDGIDQDCNGYDLTIDITRARYTVAQDQLVVWATSAWGDQAGLQVTIDLQGGGTVDKPLTWKANKSRWQKTIKNFAAKFGSQPVSVTVHGDEGSEYSGIELN